jgi:hypothetical protein
MMEELLAKMHEALGTELLARIDSGEATASELSVARQFLNDNKFTGVPDKGNSLGALADSLPAFQDQDNPH